MANTIDLCPQCRGKLVPISERTGGFSGTKAAVGAVLVGPVGLAAGATGMRLITLQCAKCGYTIETDEKTAQAAVAFGEAFEQYCNFHASRLPRPLLPHELPNPHSDKEMHFKGYAHREEERKKIGIDIDLVEKEVEQAKTALTQEIEPKIQDLQATIQKLEKSKEEKEKELASLGFFKLSQKNALKAEIASIEAQIPDTQKQAEQLSATLSEQIKTRTSQIRHELVERCRALAYVSLDEYCFDEYREFAKAIISVLSGEPMSGEEIGTALNCNNMTGAQISQRLGFVGSPFISCTSTSPYEAKWYLGADGEGNQEAIKHIQTIVHRGKTIANENDTIWNFFTAENQYLLDKLHEIQVTLSGLMEHSSTDLEDTLSGFQTRARLLSTLTKSFKKIEHKEILCGIDLLQEGIALVRSVPPEQVSGDRDFWERYRKYGERIRSIYDN